MNINIVVPIAGNAQRFVDEGFMVPKPLIMVGHKHMIDWAMSSIDYSDCNLIFLVRKDHIAHYSIDVVLKDKFGDDIKIIIVDKVTRGTLSTCLLARELINNDDGLVIYTPDVCFDPIYDPKLLDESLDGLLLTFKANSPDHSYVKTNEEGRVEATAEKEVISDEAAVGVYQFKHGKNFVKFAEHMEENEITTNGEFYVCPVYNFLVDGNIRTRLVSKMHVLGTPTDLDFFTSRTIVRFGNKPVALCSDHSGFRAKNDAKKILDQLNIKYIDFGTYVQSDCDHYDFLSQAVRHIADDTCDFGMAFCRTGQGFNISANKVQDIRSALIFDDYMAEYAIRHNAANFFCLPSQYVDKESMLKIIMTLQSSSFDGGRHATRIQKIDKDKRLFNV